MSSMQAEGRKSPRESIKQWLSAKSEVPQTRQRYEDEKKVHHRRSTERQRRKEAHTGDLEPRWQGAVEDTAGHFTASTSSAKPDLQAPFRNFTYDSKVSAEERDQIRSPKKRRRTDTRKSPPLEPAATIDLAARGNERHVDFHYSQELLKDKKRKKLTASDSPSPSTSVHLAPSYARGESYRKRRRHKTRDDRFTLKAARRTGEHSEKEHDPVRKPTKRRRTEKTGAALVHEFNASNVPQERLTVHCLFPIKIGHVALMENSAKRVALTWSFCKRKGVIFDETTGL